MFYKRIKMYRMKNHLSKKEFAAQLGVKKSDISKWESGISIPSSKEIIKIAMIFHITVSELLNINDDEWKSFTQDEKSVYMFEKAKCFFNNKQKILKYIVLIFLLTIILRVIFGILSVINLHVPAHVSINGTEYEVIANDFPESKNVK